MRSLLLAAVCGHERCVDDPDERVPQAAENAKEDQSCRLVKIDDPQDRDEHQAQTEQQRSLVADPVAQKSGGDGDDGPDDRGERHEKPQKVRLVSQGEDVEVEKEKVEREIEPAKKGEEEIEPRVPAESL